MSAPAHIRRSAGKDNWQTPEAFLIPVRQRFGDFTVDVCADANNKAADYFFEGPCLGTDDCVCGLCSSWENHLCWMNPPYSDVKTWVRKAIIESVEADATVVALLPVATSTEWFHYILLPNAHEILFLQGRIPFIHPPGCDCLACQQGKKGSNTVDSLLAIFCPGRPPEAGAYLSTWAWRAPKAKKVKAA